MGYPAGVITRTIVVGPFYDESGALITQGSATVTATRALRWIADGSTIYAVPETRLLDSNGKATFVRPVTDQAGFDDGAGGLVSGWMYRARVNIPRRKVPNESAFTLPAAGTTLTVRFDLTTTVVAGVTVVVDDSSRQGALAALAGAQAAQAAAASAAGTAGTAAAAAASSAGAANTSAGAASGSATAASGSATAAATSATAAGTSATNAGTSATAAAGSATTAQGFAGAAQAASVTTDTLLNALLLQTGPKSATRATLDTVFSSRTTVTTVADLAAWAAVASIGSRAHLTIPSIGGGTIYWAEWVITGAGGAQPFGPIQASSTAALDALLTACQATGKLAFYGGEKAATDGGYEYSWRGATNGWCAVPGSGTTARLTKGSTFSLPAQTAARIAWDALPLNAGGRIPVPDGLYFVLPWKGVYRLRLFVALSTAIPAGTGFYQGIATDATTLLEDHGDQLGRTANDGRATTHEYNNTAVGTKLGAYLYVTGSTSFATSTADAAHTPRLTLDYVSWPGTIV